MNESWKEKWNKKKQELKSDPKAAKSFLLLKIAFVDALAFILITQLNISGGIGLFLRVICFVILMATLIMSMK